MMDVSDGLALDLSRLAAASGLRLVLERVPVHADARRAARRGRQSALEHALHDGEDHELVAALSARDYRDSRASLERDVPGLTRIGRAEVGRGLLLALPGTEPALWDGSGGWRHGA